MLKYAKYRLKTENDYLKTQTKHSLYIPFESCNNKNSSPRYVNSCMHRKCLSPALQKYSQERKEQQ